MDKSRILKRLDKIINWLDDGSIKEKLQNIKRSSNWYTWTQIAKQIDRVLYWDELGNNDFWKSIDIESKKDNIEVA